MEYPTLKGENWPETALATSETTETGGFGGVRLLFRTKKREEGGIGMIRRKKAETRKN